MEWDDARYVLAIHREVSLSRAGQKLGVNQSTVGRRLEDRAHEEPPRVGIAVMVRLRDEAAALGEKSGDCRDDADAIGTGQREDEMHLRPIRRPGPGSGAAP